MKRQGMKKSAQPKLAGIADVLAQAQVVAAAFGRWPGFIVMMAALVVILTLGILTILAASKALAHLVS
jgi:low affinity Fe/Cu permease